jgi:hypothetical protein
MRAINPSFSELTVRERNADPLNLFMLRAISSGILNLLVYASANPKISITNPDDLLVRTAAALHTCRGQIKRQTA